MPSTKNNALPVCPACGRASEQPSFWFVCCRFTDGEVAGKCACGAHIGVSLNKAGKYTLRTLNSEEYRAIAGETEIHRIETTEAGAPV